MTLKSMFLSAALGVAGTLFLANTAHAQPGAAPPAGAPAVPAARPNIAVFNMAAVMRDFGQAKYQVHLLNQKKDLMSKELLAWRGEYIQLQQDMQKTTVQAEKERMGKRMVELGRLIQDKDTEINKVLNDDASAIISDLYDKIKNVVDKTAEMNGYHIVFAYPDAVTPEEIKSPYIKELKLKPPAAQPFYVAPHVDVTGIVVKTLNHWYKPIGPDGKEVDVTKLATPTPPSTTPPAGGNVPPKGP